MLRPPLRFPGQDFFLDVLGLSHDFIIPFRYGAWSRLWEGLGGLPVR